MDTSTRSTWIIAGAVVFAGLLVAAGVFFGDSGDADTNNNSSSDPIVAAAQAAEIDIDDFQACLDSDQFQTEVQDDVNNAAEAGGRGTPFNVLVSSDPLSSETQSQIKSLISSIKISQDGRRLAISGAVPYNALTQIIDLTLSDPAGPDTASTSDDININPVEEADQIRGDQDAEVVLVEYSDFRCPFCSDFHTTMKQVVDTYEGDQVAWVYRHFPIPQLHPDAPRIARASECVADLGGDEAFWSFADHFFANQ